MDLSIITVTWNSAKFINKQIQSVKKSANDLKFEQIVVDNNSSDETVNIVEQDSSIKLIKNSTNKGFAAANNQAVGQAIGDYILFLNPDMELKAHGMLQKMCEYMKENKDIGILSCKLVDKNNKSNSFTVPRRFPKIWQQIALILKLPHLWPGILNKYYYKDLDLNKICQVDTVRGSFMLVPRKIINELEEVFDNRYHIWFEDIDFCRQVKKMGYKIIYNPQFSCIDLVGQSFKQADHLNRQKQFINSMIIYFKKWEPWYKWIWLELFRPVGILMTWVYIKLK